MCGPMTAAAWLAVALTLLPIGALAVAAWLGSCGVLRADRGDHAADQPVPAACLRADARVRPRQPVPQRSPEPRLRLRTGRAHRHAAVRVVAAPPVPPCPQRQLGPLPRPAEHRAGERVRRHERHTAAPLPPRAQHLDGAAGRLSVRGAEPAAHLAEGRRRLAAPPGVEATRAARHAARRAHRGLRDALLVVAAGVPTHELEQRGGAGRCGA